MEWKHPTINQNEIKGEIILFDRFGNAVTNITHDHVNWLDAKKIMISVGEFFFEYVKFYNEGENYLLTLLLIVTIY